MGSDRDPNRERAEQLLHAGQDPGGAFGDLSAKYESTRNNSAGSGRETCFTGRSPVLTALGWRAIHLLKQGDLVASIAPASGQGRLREVIKLKRHRLPARIWELRLQGTAAVLETTGNHASLTERGWIRTRALRAGDAMPFVDEAPSLSMARIESVAPTNRFEETFNLVTHGENNFVVAGVVAHNFSVWPQARGMLANAWHLASKWGQPVEPVTATACRGRDHIRTAGRAM